MENICNCLYHFFLYSFYSFLFLKILFRIQISLLMMIKLGRNNISNHQSPQIIIDSTKIKMDLISLIVSNFLFVYVLISLYISWILSHHPAFNLFLASNKYKNIRKMRFNKKNDDVIQYDYAIHRINI
jgi:hypothetical protein